MRVNGLRNRNMATSLKAPLLILLSRKLDLYSQPTLLFIRNAFIGLFIRAATAATKDESIVVKAWVGIVCPIMRHP